MMIVQTLSRRQHDKGFLSREDLVSIASQYDVPLHRIEQIVSFYPHFRREPASKVDVAICRDMSCRLRGSKEICRKLKERFSTVSSTELSIREVSCLGRCDRAPAAMINEKLLVDRDEVGFRKIIDDVLKGVDSSFDTDRDWASQFQVHWQIDPYRSTPNYDAVRSFLRNGSSPAFVIDAIRTAGLTGMGGAGGDTASKWDDVLKAKGTTKYVVCNGDESEPGTFKDRDLLLLAPHLVLEGMILGGLVVGAERGYVYIRHEYTEQIEAVEKAIEHAVSLGACGRGIFGTSRSFELEVFVSPGGYICGEQTALIEAMESKRAEPRNRPPELQTNGLFDKPTLLNNVETFAWMPSIMLRHPDSPSAVGVTDPQATTKSSLNKSPIAEPVHSNQPTTQPGLWYRQAGRKTVGRRFFSVSGDVNRPGPYEVPCGITLHELLFEYAGGIRKGLALKAVALSGPSGGFLPAKLPARLFRFSAVDENKALKYPELQGDSVDILKLPLDLAASRSIGFPLAGGIVVYASDADMMDQALGCTQFFQSESCGKCVPCRIGTRKLVDLAFELQSSPLATERIEQVSESCRDLEIVLATSICGLGQVASKPLRTLITFLPSEIRSVSSPPSSPAKQTG